MFGLWVDQLHTCVDRWWGCTSHQACNVCAQPSHDQIHSRQKEREEGRGREGRGGEGGVFMTDLHAGAKLVSHGYHCMPQVGVVHICMGKLAVFNLPLVC